MPVLTIESTGTDFGRALDLATALEFGVVTSSSATEIVLTLAFFGGVTWTLTGTGLTTTEIAGVTYINGGTVDGLAIDEGAGVTYRFTELSLAGTALRNAWRNDADGTNHSALENLFRGMSYTFMSGNGRTTQSDHTVTESTELLPLLPTRGNAYYLGTGNNLVTAAGAGGDTIFGGDGNDTLNGNRGDDVIHGEYGFDDIFGGLGNDTLFGVGTPHSIASFITESDRLYGGEGNDVIAMASIPDDFAFAYGECYGGAGNDTIVSNTEASVLIDGGTGSDAISLLVGVAHGGAGNDTISASWTFGSRGVEVFGEGGNDILSGLWNGDILRGGVGNDTVSGGASADSLFGGRGNDQLFGDAGSDTLFGEEGNDTLVGGVEGDALNGGEGIDLASYAAAGAGVVLSLALLAGTAGEALGDTYTGIENVLGSAHADDITGDDLANALIGGDGNDTLGGLGGNDTLSGGTADDSLSGGTEDDSLSGGTGNDILSGGSGNDTLTGGTGVDVMTGDAGADVFLFLSVRDTGNLTSDVITDFASGEDVVSLAGLGLTFVTGAFTGANQIRWDAGTSRLQIDANGDGAVDRQVVLVDVGFAFDSATDLLL